MRAHLSSAEGVIWALLTYADRWQPTSSSCYRVGGRGRRPSEGISPAVLDGIDVRDELCRRMERLGVVDRELLFLWYVQQLTADEIAKVLAISRRQCFRRRARAIATLSRADEAA